MAKFIITKIMHFGTPDLHTSTDWQVATDPDFINIIDESLADTVNLKEWHTPLKKLDGSGYYTLGDELFARAKAHFGKAVSGWFNLRDDGRSKYVVLTYGALGTAEVISRDDYNNIAIGDTEDIMDILTEFDWGSIIDIPEYTYDFGDLTEEGSVNLEFGFLN